MTDAVTEDGPVCNSSDRAKEQFATAKVAKHVKEKAHQEWIDTYTTNGTLIEIRSALEEHNRPRQ